MRQWHRWMGICVAVFMVLIGVTGVAIQVLDLAAAKTVAPVPGSLAAANTTSAPMVSKHGDGHRRANTGEHADADAATPDAKLAEPRKQKQPPSAFRRWSHWIKDVHSGVMFGPIGIFVSIVSGLALTFFAISGMWMYWQMFTRRKAAGRMRFFWTR